jgi:hypothetical protein
VRHLRLGLARLAEPRHDAEKLAGVNDRVARLYIFPWSPPSTKEIGVYGSRDRIPPGCRV